MPSDDIFLHVCYPRTVESVKKSIDSLRTEICQRCMPKILEILCNQMELGLVSGEEYKT